MISSICLSCVMCVKVLTGFLAVANLNGKGLTNRLRANVEQYFGVAVGQGYDGAAVMSGRLNGVQALSR